MRELAYRYYPWGGQGGNYREYTAEELMNPEKVEALFDYCQILEAYITAEGWHFLIAHHGFEKLYEIDRKSGWYDFDTLAEYIELICGNIRDAEQSREKDKAELETLELQMTPEAIRDLKAYAESKGMSPQNLIRTALEEYRHTRGELHTPRYLITFCPDKGIFFSYSCAAEERYGYQIAPGELPFSPEITAAIRNLYQDYIGLKSPEQPYQRPNLTPQQCAAFNARANALFEKASAELGEDYQIQKQKSWF
ncbi:MAG: hypothetical protein J5722_04400 [Oscillospiraceae bacterium]|nr:hypothetical protein [Oscillospiraceae bacterium]